MLVPFAIGIVLADQFCLWSGTTQLLVLALGALSWYRAGRWFGRPAELCFGVALGALALITIGSAVAELALDLIGQLATRDLTASLERPVLTMSVSSLVVLGLRQWYLGHHWRAAVMCCSRVLCTWCRFQRRLVRGKGLHCSMSDTEMPSC